MATNTPRLNLRKPGASDNVDVTADLDANFDILDNAALVNQLNTFASRQVFNDGVDVRNGPNAYGHGELRFGGGDIDNLPGGQGFGITDNYTGSPRFYFDHRGTINTGDWIWRNGSTAVNTQMSLSGVGDLVTAGRMESIGFRATGDPGGVAGTLTFTGGSGVGNAAGVGLTMLGKGTGTGPINSQVVEWVKMYFGTAIGWIPMFQ